MRITIGLALVLACANRGTRPTLAKSPSAAGVTRPAATERASTTALERAPSGAGQRNEAEPSEADGASGRDPEPAAPSDASATATQASEASDEGDVSEVLRRESLGPLHWGITEAELSKVVGIPTERSKPTLEGATGMYVALWRYAWAGVALVMAADKKTGPWTARLITVSKSNRFATAAGIRVGSARAAVEQRYHRSSEPIKDDQFLVGSIYGGLLFSFDGGVVSSISIGPFAF